MKKAFDQTVRDLKRGVNKNVLKLPGIEQKVLDATNNEPWGPHGSLLADIAQSSRNYHEYQMAMGVIWKRINDTGKNWRHVYKALTVLEFLVAHGSERVIEEIKEHAYQITTLSNFQYIDSSGQDQGSNVRKKSQGLVALVNDKERIAEVRQKAASNRDKFRSVAGGMYKPSSYSSAGGYGDRYDNDRYEGRYGSRDEDHNGYGRERDYEYRDADRHSRDGERRGYEERYGRDGYKDDDYRGRSRSVDGYGSRSRSSDREFDDDGQSPSRGSGARVEDRRSHDGRGHEKKYSEQNIGAPPSYEEAVNEARSPVYSETERDVETSAVSAPGGSPSASNNANKETDGSANALSPAHHDGDEAFNEFDPRGPTVGSPAVVSGTATPPAPASVTSTATPTNNAEFDLLSCLSDSFPLAIMPAPSSSDEPGTHDKFGEAPPFSSTQSTSQPFEDPFGETPFRAISSAGTDAAPFQPAPNHNAEMFQPAASKADPADNFGFGDSFSAITYSPPGQGLETDVLAGILLPSDPNGDSYVAPGNSYMASQSHNLASEMQFPQQGSAVDSQISHHAVNGQAGQFNSGNYTSQPGYTAPLTYVNQQTPGLGAQHNSNVMGPSGLRTSASLPAIHSSSSMDTLAIVPQSAKDKFEPKSSIWADTLSRGLVNFNISGPKTNPLADIGVDFDAINRRDKRMEKPAANPVTSTVTMGKAMGSGSGAGRAAASSFRPPTSVMGMGMSGAPGAGTNMGRGYGGMNQPMMGMGMNQPMMGMGMNQPMMGMGMNVGMGQGGQMPQQPGMVPGSAMSGGYNPMMGSGNNPTSGSGGYTQQNQYGGGYR